MKIHKNLNATGQLSIFALLIFQTLFILFAMSLNIALVVHDKINLQNSVDIAAYYGAMKQAEMLNAIAHINYQIRQSWKLLTWRYRVLGSMSLTDIPKWGVYAHKSDEEHPLFPFPVFSRKSDGQLRLNRDRQPIFLSKGIPGPYFFCVAHKDWGGVTTPNPTPPPDDDMLCAGMNEDHDIPRIQISRMGGSRFLGGLGQTFASIYRVGDQINNDIKEKCSVYGVNSWLLGAYSFLYFLRDQSERKKMIYELLKKLTAGKDLDGGEIDQGADKTFKKNLTFINREAVSQGGNDSKIEFFSTLTNKAPETILQDQAFIFEGLYSRLTGNEIKACTKRIGFIKEDIQDGNLKKSYPKLNLESDSIKNLTSVLTTEESWPGCSRGMGSVCSPSAGMIKKDYTVYYAVRAELDYQNQIFLPFKLTLKAEAFAKPFGGRIGPPRSEDKLLPPDRYHNYNGGYQFDKIYAPNYSRYPGDQLGLRSKLVHYYWTRTVRDSYLKKKDIKNYMKEGPDGRFEGARDRDPMVRCFSSEIGGCIAGGIKNATLLARKWEIAAVAPDLFDVTYFTILPYYQYAYFPKIQKLLGNAPYLRGDLGTYYDGNNFKGTTLLHQVMTHTNQAPPFPPEQDIWHYLKSRARLVERPPYKIHKLELLLTGWNPPQKKYAMPPKNTYSHNDYRETSFGQCSKWVHGISNIRERLMNDSLPQTSIKGVIANGCVYGGRTGYSVKMVNPDFLEEINAEPPPWRRSGI